MPLSPRPAFLTSVLRAVGRTLRLPLDLLQRTFDPDDSRIRPSDSSKSDDVAREKSRVQVRVIQNALGDGVALAASDGAGRATDLADVAYLYRPSHLLVRRDRLDEVLDFFARNKETFHDDGGLQDQGAAIDVRDERFGEPVPGLVLMRTPRRRDERDDVLQTLEELEQALDGRQDPDHPVATPDHLLYVTSVGGGRCPADEPEVPRRTTPWPPQNSDTGAGSGVRVSVVDTGLWMGSVTDPATPWMKDVVPEGADDKESLDLSAIREYGGHGTFISGIVKCLAPASHVEVEGWLSNAGATFESEMCQKLHEALDDPDDLQLISISAGTHTRKDMASLGFDMLKEALGDGLGGTTLVIAAAGNDSSSSPFWPAAFEWVTGVGSVDANGHLSDFSNYGHWVDIYARGRDLVNAFPSGTYTCYEPQNIHNGVPDVRHFTSLAQWSGTSFATPVVTGLVAAAKTPTNTIVDALDAVLDSATVINGHKVVGPLT